MQVVICIVVLCLVVVYAKTECEKHRERELSHEAMGRVIPVCNDNDGSYQPLQCFEGSDFCHCWDKKGNHVSRPSSKLKYCDCSLDKHESEEFDSTGDFLHIPTCQEDGKYTPTQCFRDECWCVNELSGEKLTDLKEGEKCPN